MKYETFYKDDMYMSSRSISIKSYQYTMNVYMKYETFISF